MYMNKINRTKGAAAIPIVILCLIVAALVIYIVRINSSPDITNGNPSGLTGEVPSGIATSTTGGVVSSGSVGANPTSVKPVQNSDNAAQPDPVSRTYMNASLGFSTKINSLFTEVSEPQDIGYSVLPAESKAATLSYALGSQTTARGGIVVWQSEASPCESGDSIEGAAGSTYHVYKRMIQNGRKAFCIVGFARVTNPYNSFDPNYAKVVEQNNARAIESLKSALNIFVANFQIN